MRSTSPATPIPGHQKNNFDFLRFFAAFLVLFSHQHVLTGRPEPVVLGVHSYGGIGVLIFFSISGYLIAESWKRNPRVIDFVRNRFLRIWPAFAVMVLLMALVLGPVASTDSVANYFAEPQTFKYLRMLYFRMHYGLPGVFVHQPVHDVNGSIWTIPIELKWYGILLLLGLTRLSRYRLFFLPAAAVFMTYMLVIYNPSLDRREWTAEFGVYFLIGMIISDFSGWFARYKWYVTLVGFVLSFIAVRIGYPFLALACVVPALSLAVGTQSWLPFSAFGRFGDFSYGFYLYAFPVQQTYVWLVANQQPFLVGLVITGVATMICAVLSWKLIEAPALRLKRRAKPQTQSPAVDAGRALA
jgi:peptidoglycan/LPS O-acetylase OafA/YrhL